MKDVEANFSWISFKQLIIIKDFETNDEYKQGDIINELKITSCQGHFICEM
jgi:hypothetical protein